LLVAIVTTAVRALPCPSLYEQKQLQILNDPPGFFGLAERGEAETTASTASAAPPIHQPLPHLAKQVPQ
jgi:hypothetical protein